MWEPLPLKPNYFHEQKLNFILIRPHTTLPCRRFPHHSLPDLSRFMHLSASNTISSLVCLDSIKKAAQKTSVNLKPGFVGSHDPDK
jgi:hypothetical protein